MGLREEEPTQEKTPLKVEQVPWSAEAEQGLNLTLFDDRKSIRKLVDKDIARLWKVNGGQIWAVIAGELDELVICCLQGKGLHDFMPFLIAQARKQGFKTIRCHTDRKGLIKLLARYGVRQREVVLELNL